MPLSRQTLSFIALLSLSAACKQQPDSKTTTTDTTISHTPAAPQASIIGTWSGVLENDKITLFIDRMDNGEMSGHSVCAGYDRPFKGIYREEADTIAATLKEPGDNKHDGIFELVISKSPPKIGGKWTPFDTSRSVLNFYFMTPKSFTYNPHAGRYSEASTRLLTSDDVENLYKDDLRYMRNEIYARHGYAFRLEEVQLMFNDKDWYMPISTDVRKSLTPIEIKNEQLIKRYEQHAETYDDFGR